MDAISIRRRHPAALVIWGLPWPRVSTDDFVADTTRIARSMSSLGFCRSFMRRGRHRLTDRAA